MVLTPNSCSLPPHTWSQVHLSCTFSGLASDVDRAPFGNNEGLIKRGKSLAPLDMGEGNGWIVALGLCGTRGSLSRGPALKAAASVAPCPPVSCMQHILSPLCLQPLQPLPQLAAAGKTGKAQGWVGAGYMGVNQGEKAKLDFSRTPVVPSRPFSTLFFLPPSAFLVSLVDTMGEEKFWQQGTPWPPPILDTSSGPLYCLTTLCLPQPQLVLGISLESLLSGPFVSTVPTGHTKLLWAHPHCGSGLAHTVQDDVGGIAVGPSMGTLESSPSSPEPFLTSLSLRPTSGCTSRQPWKGLSRSITPVRSCLIQQPEREEAATAPSLQIQAVVEPTEDTLGHT